MKTIIGLIRYKMRLDFMRHVYDAKKDRRDLRIAGEITAPAWTVLRKDETAVEIDGLADKDAPLSPPTPPALHPVSLPGEKTPPAS